MKESDAVRRSAKMPKLVDSPEMADLFEKLHFDPKQGGIWLGDERMLLIHAEAFGTFRRDLIESLGFDIARELITRFGYISGTEDAKLARTLRKDKSSWEQFLAGPHLHALTGFLASAPQARGKPLDRPVHEAEAIWKESFEANAHIKAFGIGSMPACWMEVGYASGFMSALSGRRMLVKEQQCKAMGHDHCLAIAKPIEAWDEIDEDKGHGPAASNSDARQNRRRHYVFSPHKGRKNGPVGSSSAFNTIMHRIERVAATDATVLFLGESGVGKSLLAREVHKQSKRADKTFIEVNCAAIPEQLIEAEMFGVEKGAYTGATETRPGRFEVADGGTIFLDEVSLLTPTAQSKLLRILQTGDMEYLGSNKTRKVDVRLIAATNENLTTAIREGRFREDLFYRLNVFPISIPPLRKRSDDLPDLIEMCLTKFARRHGRNVTDITARAFEDMLNYHWPGNVRELENIIERAIILADDGEPLDTFHLFAFQESPEGADDNIDMEQPLKMLNTPRASDRKPAGDVDGLSEALFEQNIAISDIENRMTQMAMEESGGNVTQAAQRLGISRAQLSYRLKKMAADS